MSRKGVKRDIKVSDRIGEQEKREREEREMERRMPGFHGGAVERRGTHRSDTRLEGWRGMEREGEGEGGRGKQRLSMARRRCLLSPVPREKASQGGGSAEGRWKLDLRSAQTITSHCAHALLSSPGHFSCTSTTTSSPNRSSRREALSFIPRILAELNGFWRSVCENG